MGRDNNSVDSDQESTIDDSELRISKLREARDLLVACFDLLNDDISAQQWLGKMGNLANCSSVTCVWWRAGQPDTYIKDVFGPEIPLSADYLHRLDHLLTSIGPSAPGLLDELAQNAGIQVDSPNHPLLTPDRLIACLDWDPAYVLIFFGGRSVSPDWQPYDRKRFAELLPIIHTSVSIKKRLSRGADSIELSGKIIDEASRGYIMLTPERAVTGSNLIANNILKQGKLIRLVGNRLEFRDQKLQLELEHQLAELTETDEESLGKFGWFKNLGKLADAGDLLLTMRAFKLDSWRLESSTHNKIAVITLEMMTPPAMPDEAKLREFFNLTRAQARLVKELTRSTSVEETASALHISVNTVRSHLRAIYDRMGVSNKAQLLQRVSSTLAGRTTPSD